MLSYQDYLQKLKNIKLVSIDVDGTMTSGELYYLDDGREVRSYNVKDGLGILMLQAVGVKTAMMTTGNINAIRMRGERLRMDYVEMGVFDKAKRLKEIATEMGISMDDVVHIGDDINDISAFKEVGMAVIVNDAAMQTEKVADYKLKAAGGKGAIRELAEDYYKTVGKEFSWDVAEDFIHSRKAMGMHKLSNG